MHNSSITKFDVIVVGGGMVGLSLVAGLLCESKLFENKQQQKLKIAVLDPTEISTEFSPSLQSRVSALTRTSQLWLEQLGAWQQIPKDRLSAYRKMHIWDAQGDGDLNFKANDLAEPNLGHIVENSVIRAALANSLKTFTQQGQLQILAPATARKVEIDSDEVRLFVTNEKQQEERILQARLIVAADGARSWLRNQLAIPVSQHHYQQKALVALVSSEKSHQQTAWQKFHSTGPLAFLPMKDSNLHSIVWSNDNDRAKELLSLEPSDFIQQLELGIDRQFGQLELSSKLASFPLIATHARRYTGHRAVLIGDAAHTIHPLAGQGVNLGFLDAKALTDTLTDPDKNLLDLGNSSLLRRYERNRRGDNLAVQSAMTLFQKGFGQTNPVLSKALSWGMNTIDKNLQLKKAFIKRAMGI